MSIERYLLFTKFVMKTVFSHMYVEPNLQRYRRAAMFGRAGNRTGGKYFQKMVNSWLSSFTVYLVTLCVPLREHKRATSGTRAPGWSPLPYSILIAEK